MESDASSTLGFPRAEGSRLPWAAMPESVLGSIEEGFGARIVDVVTQPGGFSPGIAARVRLSDGGRAFVKAISSVPNPHSPRMHRGEVRIAQALPADAPVPRFLFAVDDGEWVALAFEDIEGVHPHLPWKEEQLARVLGAMSDLAASLTPAPAAVASVLERSGVSFPFTGWHELSSDVDADIDPWARENLDRLVDLEDGWGGASDGESLVHGDLRADNILLTRNRVVFVDWPHASIGAGWLDLVFFLPSVAMQRGPKPWTVFGNHPLARSVPVEHVDAAVAALAGFFVRKGSLPSPPGLAGLREFAEAQGVEALAWLRHRVEGQTSG